MLCQGKSLGGFQTKFTDFMPYAQLSGGLFGRSERFKNYPTQFYFIFYLIKLGKVWVSIVTMQNIKGCFCKELIYHKVPPI